MTDPDFVILEPEDGDPQEQGQGREPLAEGRRVLTTHTLQKAVADQIYIAMKERNAVVLKVLVEIWRATGAKSFEVKAPTVDGGEEKVGLISLTIPADKTVITDEDAFLDWLEANRPELVSYIHHDATPPVPAMPAWDEAVIAPEALKTLTTEGRVAGAEVLTGDGELIPGLKHVPAGEPREFRVTWGGAGMPLKKKALDLLTGNEIAGTTLSGIVPLPELDT